MSASAANTIVHNHRQRRMSLRIGDRSWSLRPGDNRLPYLSPQEQAAVASIDGLSVGAYTPPAPSRTKRRRKR